MQADEREKIEAGPIWPGEWRKKSGLQNRPLFEWLKNKYQCLNERCPVNIIATCGLASLQASMEA